MGRRAMNRRVFLKLLGACAVAGPCAAHAQTGVPHVGVLHPGGPYVSVIEGMREGLKQQGLEEQKDLVLHERVTKVDPKQVDETVQALIREKVRLIVTVGTTITRNAKPVARDVPIVFCVGSDPVMAKLVESFANPGGLLTGVHYLTTDLTAKRFEVLTRILPKLRRVLLLYNPDNPTPQESLKAARQTAKQLHLELVEGHVKTREDLQARLQTLKPGEVDAFFYISDANIGSQSQLIIDAAKKLRLPTMFHERITVVRGALASYGVNYHEIGRLSAKFIQRIVAGANPKDLPVENIDRLEFVLNLGTARAIGLTIPQTVVLRADHVIQ
jgi:putative ABC transport system substrate-binding protein